MFPEKSLDSNFLKKLKNLKNSYKKILIKKTGFFSENRALLLLAPYDPLTSCKELGKTNEPFSVTFDLRTIN